MVTHAQRQWWGFFLSGLLLVSTSGIPVHKLVCLCKGEQTIQFYAEPEGCCASQVKKAESDCCSGSSCQPATACSNSGHTCQDKEVSFLKIVDQYLDSAPSDLQSPVTIPPAPRSFIWKVDLATHEGHAGKVRFVPYQQLFAEGPIYRTSCQIRC